MPRGAGIPVPEDEIPAQGPGPHFSVSPDLRIGLAPPTEIDADGNNLARIRQLLPTVRQAAGDLAGHVSLNSQPEISRNLTQYRDAVAGEPETIAWGTVFGLGVRLENAATAAQRDIGNRLQEPLEDAAQEALDSLLTLHGPLILATQEGRELSEQADQFRMTREEQTGLREAALQVAEALKNSDLAEAAAARLTEEAVEIIGEGRHPERGTVFAMSTIKNVTALIAGLAAASIAAERTKSKGRSERGGSDGSKYARWFEHLHTSMSNLLQRGVPFRSFVVENEKPLRRIAENSTQLHWMTHYIDFIVRTNLPEE